VLSLLFTGLVGVGFMEEKKQPVQTIIIPVVHKAFIQASIMV